MAESNVKDSGNILNDSNPVTLIKSLKVKGGGVTLKQGALVKKIALRMTIMKLIAKLTACALYLKLGF